MENNTWRKKQQMLSLFGVKIADGRSAKLT